MKIFQVVDLLQHKLVILREPENEGEFSVHDKVLLRINGDEVVGKVVSLVRDVPSAKVDDDYVFVRRLTKEDIAAFEKTLSDERARVIEARSCVEEANLPMEIFASRCDFSGKIFSFFFIAEEKIDFRDLLKIMARQFKARIHLQRVGARDRAKIIGGFGSCGRETCCSSFKVELDSIPLDAARDQNLITKNNDKLMGLCGKLKCCLVYELPLYREMRRFLPHIRQAVTLKDGKQGRVVGLDILNQKVKVLLDDADIGEVYDIADLRTDKKMEGRPTPKNDSDNESDS